MNPCAIGAGVLPVFPMNASTLQVLNDMLHIEHVSNIVIAGRDGLPIASVGNGVVSQADKLAAYCVSSLNSAEFLGKSLTGAMPQGILIEFSDALISVEPLGQYAVFIASLQSPRALPHMRHYLAQYGDDLLRTLDDVPSQA